MTSDLLWLAPLISLLVGASMLLCRDRRWLTVLDLAGSVTILALVVLMARGVAQAGSLLVTAKVYLPPGGQLPIDQAERVLRTLQNRDLTPPKR